MDVREVTRLHAMCRALDPRIPAPDRDGVIMSAWQIILQDVPGEDTEEIIRRLYSEPQMLVLQPGHVKKAWEALARERDILVSRVRGIDRYLSTVGVEDPDDIRREKIEQRALLLAQLPERIRSTHPALERKQNNEGDKAN